MGLFLMFVMLGWAGGALAHGVAITSGMGQAAWARGVYDDGEPMAYADVKINNPEGRTHQVGHADGQGRFCWLPGKPGAYTAVFTDGMGHRGETRLEWRGDGGPAPAEAPPEPAQASPGLRGQPKWAGAIWGLSAIFWISGLFFWLRGRRIVRDKA